MADVRKVKVVPVLAVAGLYAAGDAVGAFFAIPLVLRPGAGGKIVGIEIIDKAAQALGLTLQLFDIAPAVIADNAVYNPADADASNVVGQVVIVPGDYFGGAANKTAYKDLDLDFQVKPNEVNLYGQLSTQGAPTYAAGDIEVVFHVQESQRERF